jgi:hypothetical protein
MMKWFRHDAARRMHPKFRAAGFWGATAVEAAWEFARMFDRDDGDVTDFWRADSVAGWLQLGSEHVQDLARGMERAVTAGLIDRDEDHIVIHGWVEAQPPPARVRMAKSRERKRNDSLVTNVKTHLQPVTNVRPTYSTDITDSTDREDITDTTDAAVVDDLFSSPSKAPPYKRPESTEVPPPGSEEVATADHLREALLAAGAKCPGWRAVGAYAGKRAAWAAALRGAALEHGVSQAEIRELVTWAVAAPEWEIDGAPWTWAKVLDVARPADKLSEKLPKIAGSRERAAAAAKPRLEYVGHGGSMKADYYADGERVTYERWRELGGLFDDEKQQRARGARA